MEGWARRGVEPGLFPRPPCLVLAGSSPSANVRSGSVALLLIGRDTAVMPFRYSFQGGNDGIITST